MHVATGQLQQPLTTCAGVHWLCLWGHAFRLSDAHACRAAQPKHSNIRICFRHELALLPNAL